MSQSAQESGESALRTRVRQLRQDLEITTRRYTAAKQDGDAARTVLLLREKSTLIRQLFEAQSALLVSFRGEGSRADFAE